MAETQTTRRTQPDLAAPTPWQPRRLVAGEWAARELISCSFPSGSADVQLEELAALLRVGQLGLRFRGISPVCAGLSKDVVLIALGQADGAGGRAVLGIDVALAWWLVQTVLGRANTAELRPLTTGEQGALLYALDRAGGDWLTAGGGRFTVRGLLADTDQVASYLGGQPTWEVSGSLSKAPLPTGLWLWLVLPHTSGFVRSGGAVRWERAREWLVKARITAGETRLSPAEVQALETGDLVLLDTARHPLFKGSGSWPRVRCGGWVRPGRWLDAARIEILDENKKGLAMETKPDNAKEVQAQLEPPAPESTGEMQVVVHVEVGKVEMSVEQALRLVPGRVLLLDREIGPEVALFAGDKLVARGELVDHEGQLGVEISEVP